MDLALQGNSFFGFLFVFCCTENAQLAYMYCQELEEYVWE